MTGRELLLKELDDTHTLLERLHQEEHDRGEPVAGALARRLSYLEQRVLQLQTQLSALALRVRRSSPDEAEAEDGTGLLARLNPWHPEFRMEAYVVGLTILMAIMFVLQVVLGWT